MDISEQHTGAAIPIIDVSKVPLVDLISQADDTVLANAMRRVVEAAVAETDGGVSEFESSI
jgi:FXSXX-COOH protein